jgi:hypothetical protein
MKIGTYVEKTREDEKSESAKYTGFRPRLSFEQFDPTTQSLEVFVYDPGFKQKVHIRIDNTRQSKDTVYFITESSQSDDKRRIISRSAIAMAEITKLFQLELVNGNYITGKTESHGKADSLSRQLQRNGPFTFSQINENLFMNDAVRTYTGLVSDGKGNQASFYASSDPVPLIIIVGAACYGLWKLWDNQSWQNQKTVIAAIEACERKRKGCYYVDDNSKSVICPCR